MAISRIVCGVFLLVSLSASARELATPAACQAAGAQPLIANAQIKAASTQDLRASYLLADAWSDAGCFKEALQVLSAAMQVNPNNQELKTRVRVARSVVGEEHFFENLDRVDDEARLKRATFRCTSLSDPVACREAARMRPEAIDIVNARAESSTPGDRPAEAAEAGTLAGATNPNQAAALPPNQLAPTAAVSAATVIPNKAQKPVRSRAPRLALAPPHPSTYSNLEQESHSH